MRKRHAHGTGRQKQERRQRLKFVAMRQLCLVSGFFSGENSLEKNSLFEIFFFEYEIFFNLNYKRSCFNQPKKKLFLIILQRPHL